jgi:hypothetical protein
MLDLQYHSSSMPDHPSSLHLVPPSPSAADAHRGADVQAALYIRATTSKSEDTADVTMGGVVLPEAAKERQMGPSISMPFHSYAMRTNLTRQVLPKGQVLTKEQLSINHHQKDIVSLSLYLYL